MENGSAWHQGTRETSPGSVGRTTSGSRMLCSRGLSPLRFLRAQPPKFRPHFSQIRSFFSTSSSASFLATSVFLTTVREAAASHCNLQRDHSPCPQSCEARRSGSLPSLELSPSLVRPYLSGRGDCETFFPSFYACESPAERKGAAEEPGERGI